jgi:hypothetical protein
VILLNVWCWLCCDGDTDEQVEGVQNSVLNVRVI